MHNVEYTLGEVYYQLGLASVVVEGDPLPIVSSWRYDGVKVLKCNSRSCEVPYHFHCFTRVTGEGDALGSEEPYHLYIASREQARLSMFTWHDFRIHVMEMANNGHDSGDLDTK